MVRVWVGNGVVLDGDLEVPSGARGAVLFAHGSGSGRLSPRNRYVASELQRAGLATLLIDLLTDEEEEAERFTRHLRFDIELLVARLLGAASWLRQQPSTRHLQLGYFGASTGAAAALVAAAREPVGIFAVVSRGGRPDLAGRALFDVRAPTLLIVGGADPEVLALNRVALSALRPPKRLEIVPGATHLFAEPGALEQVAGLASDWFVHQLARTPRAGAGDDQHPGAR
jgi:dienelactone hydrolase